MAMEIPGELASAQARFGELTAELRPALHRYCARMVGSSFDGEDIVQDALARAYYALSMMEDMPNLRPWLFRIAHNRAIDYLRSPDARRQQVPVDDVALPADEDVPLEDRELAALAMGHYLRLPAMQRSCVILKDVLDCGLAEISEVLDATVPAIKAALHRGRKRLRAIGADGVAGTGTADGELPPELVRYVEAFNAREWDTLRAMLADDVRLDVVGRAKRAGRRQVGQYFTNYSRADDWRFEVGFVDGVPAVIVRNPTSDAGEVAYVARVEFDDSGRVRSIRDFRYARYSF